MLDIADRTLIYPDTQLLQRLRARYKNFDKRDDHAIIEEGQLGEWLDAMKVILADYGIERP